MTKPTGRPTPAQRALFTMIIIFLALASLIYAAPLSRAQTYSSYAVYEGCIDARVIAPEIPGSPVVPLQSCVQVSFIQGDQPRITVVSISSPITSVAVLKRVIGESVRKALAEALTIEGRAAPAEGEFVYVRGTVPVVCKQLYKASFDGVDAMYIHTDYGLVPVMVYANVSDATFTAEVKLTLTHLSDETACGSSVLSTNKVTILKGGTLAILLGALASIIWRTKTKPVVIIYRYAPV